MERTHRWAERSLAARGSPSQAVFGIVQGGVDPELRRASVDAIGSQAFDGIAIGGLSVGESKAEMAATLDVVADALGDDPRPRYLMGVGAPPDFFTAVERGVDLFDCVLPTRVARTGQVWTDAGRLNLRNAVLPGRPRTDRSRLRLRGVPLVLPRLPRPPVPGARAPRLSARDRPQRDLDARAHAPPAGVAAGWFVRRPA